MNLAACYALRSLKGLGRSLFTDQLGVYQATKDTIVSEQS